jgi:hypothetical protein
MGGEQGEGFGILQYPQTLCYHIYMNNLSQVPLPILYILFIWSLFWKGLALWRAAKNSQKNWFVAILVINSVGILDILYLFYFAKNKMKLSDLLFWQRK